ncbi:MAG: hypothetical protein OIF50_06995 [Flavobacteriaceae bacterium]|nr:hypothetical protein [Flavobacteriaceae bacterium]
MGIETNPAIRYIRAVCQIAIRCTTVKMMSTPWHIGVHEKKMVLEIINRFDAVNIDMVQLTLVA